MTDDLPGASPKGANSGASLPECRANSNRDALPIPSARPGFFPIQIPPVSTQVENAAPESPESSVGGGVQPRPTHWTPIKISALVALWNEGLPTSEIGKRLGTSKNAVIGRARRLGLRPRSSPLPPRIKPDVIDPHEPIGCRFIFGDVKIGEWNYCQKDQQGNPSYCPEHHAKTRHKAGQIGAIFQLPNLTTLDR